MHKILSIIIDQFVILKEKEKRKTTLPQFKMTNSIDIRTNRFDNPIIPDITFKTISPVNSNYNSYNYEYLCEIKNSFDNTQKISHGICHLSPKGTGDNIIFVHGWKTHTFNRINDTFLASLVEKESSIFQVKLPYHFERESRDHENLMISAHLDRTMFSILKAVLEVRTLIQWIKKNKEGRIILIGISLGGLITNLITTIEENINLSIAVFYSDNLAYSIWNSKALKDIKRELVANNITYNELQKHLEILVPSRSLPKIPSENILLISGCYDQLSLKDDSDVLWNAWQRPKRILYNCGHAGIEFYKNKIRDDVLLFLSE